MSLLPYHQVSDSSCFPLRDLLRIKTSAGWIWVLHGCDFFITVISSSLVGFVCPLSFSVVAFLDICIVEMNLIASTVVRMEISFLSSINITMVTVVTSLLFKKYWVD